MSNSTKEVKCDPGQPGPKHLSVTGLISNFGSELSVSIPSPFRDVGLGTYTCVCMHVPCGSEVLYRGISRGYNDPDTHIHPQVSDQGVCDGVAVQCNLVRQSHRFIGVCLSSHCLSSFVPGCSIKPFYPSNYTVTKEWSLKKMISPYPFLLVCLL